MSKCLGCPAATALCRTWPVTVAHLDLEMFLILMTEVARMKISSSLFRRDQRSTTPRFMRSLLSRRSVAGAHPEVFELWPTTFLDPLFHTVVAQGEALRAEADQVSGFWICWIRWNHFSKVAGKLKNLIFCYQVKFFLNYSLQYQCPAWRGDKLCQARCVCQVWDGGDGDTGVEIHHGPAQQGRGGL